MQHFLHAILCSTADDCRKGAGLRIRVYSWQTMFQSVEERNVTQHGV